MIKSFFMWRNKLLWTMTILPIFTVRVQQIAKLATMRLQANFVQRLRSGMSVHEDEFLIIFIDW